MIVNEVTQWAFLVVVGLLVAGMLRQLSLMHPATRSVATGPGVGTHIPKSLIEGIQRVDGSRAVGEHLRVAFVTEHCAGCRELLANLVDAEELPEPIVLVAKSPTANFEEALAEVGLPVISDASGDIWEECLVTATPLVIRVDQEWRVAAKGVTHDPKTV